MTAAATRSRQRVGRRLKWVGTLLLFLVAILWAASAWFQIVVYGDRTTVSTFVGSICISHGGSFHAFRRSHHGVRPVFSRLLVRFEDFSSYDYRVPRFYRAGLRLPRLDESPDYEWRLVLPYWCVFAFIAFPTFLLWWLDCRRVPRGHCQRCGYDLTGNISGRCPECGRPIDDTQSE